MRSIIRRRVVSDFHNFVFQRVSFSCPVFFFIHKIYKINADSWYIFFWQNWNIDISTLQGVRTLKFPCLIIRIQLFVSRSCSRRPVSLLILALRHIFETAIKSYLSGPQINRSDRAYPIFLLLVLLTQTIAIYLLFLTLKTRKLIQNFSCIDASERSYPDVFHLVLLTWTKTVCWWVLLLIDVKRAWIAHVSRRFSSYVSSCLPFGNAGDCH